jgi:extracellular elastinolytic metalloproteinase
MRTIRTLCAWVIMIHGGGAFAQDPVHVVAGWLEAQRASMGLTATDAAAWSVTSTTTDGKGLTHVYIRQEVNGLPVYNAVANFAVREGAVVHHGDRLQRGLSARAPSPVPALGAVEALRRAALELGLPVEAVRVLETTSATELLLSPSGVSHDPIPARLLYQPTEDGELRLAWDLTIRSTTTPNWWHLGVDAITGRILRTTDHIVQCVHPEGGFRRPYSAWEQLQKDPVVMQPMPLDGSGYRVFPFPTESPAHGDHVLVMEPADPVASPYGWHDTDGAPGAEYTITRGNNVFAHEDLNNDDMPGYAPDGGPTLLFDQPYTPPQAPLDYLDASIINLFHANNVLHDVLYRYGFDEASGNFQVNNYGNGGLGDDEVIAQAQDGGGVNNANFGTPPDGESGRMQMYLWRSSADSTLFINAPQSIEGVYANAVAGFGPPLPGVPITADVVLAQDGVPPLNDACDPLVNAAAIAGKIALVDRGQCNFISKVLALQDAGALAVVVVNNVAGAPFGMGGTDGSGDVQIPSVMISQADGDLIKAALLQGVVNATLVGTPFDEYRDSAFDNGIIAHEYGHGVSNRLTGGGMNVDCLWNDEQMGEGWSDYIGIVLTMLPDDGPTTIRGVGTFVRDQPNDGPGIRPAPYTTDMGVNGYTYGNTNSSSLSRPHGIGFVWATMLWDLTWALIDAYGYDADLHTGNGGNNLALQLVMDGMKLQPCSPGFVDGRDAILAADLLLTGGQNECLIWNVFAQRGLGESASQGSPFDRFDQVEAFDLPIPCLTVGLDDVPEHATPGLLLAPNPATGQVRLQLDAAPLADAELWIRAMDGRLARTVPWPMGTTVMELDIAGLAAALYVVELRMQGSVITERLVVQ